MLTPVMIDLTPGEITVVSDETTRRRAAYVKKKLSTDMADGDYSAFERMMVGVMGEAALLKYLDQPVDKVITDGELDGGVDVVVGGKYGAQIKTAMIARPRYFYHPKHIPLKTAVLVQAGRMSDNQINLMGWMMHASFLRKKRPIYVGSRKYSGVVIDDDMEPMCKMLDRHRALLPLASAARSFR